MTLAFSPDSFPKIHRLKNCPDAAPVILSQTKTPKTQDVSCEVKAGSFLGGGGRLHQIVIYMGVSLNGGTPKTPQNDHF